MNLDDLPDDLCPGCGRKMDDQRRLGHTYCSTKCRNAYFWGLESQALAEARSGRKCIVCGASFEAARSTKVYCSPACRRLSWRLARVARDDPGWGVRRCPVCEQNFVPTREDQTFCGQSCSAKSHPERMPLMWARRAVSRAALGRAKDDEAGGNRQKERGKKAHKD